MEVRFRTKKLKKCYEDYQAGCREWGPEVARKYVQRIDLLQEASSIEEIRRLPGLDFHPLKGRREGQYGIRLHGGWRLVIVLEGEMNEVIFVREVSMHYGD